MTPFTTAESIFNIASTVFVLGGFIVLLMIKNHVTVAVQKLDGKFSELEIKLLNGQHNLQLSFNDSNAKMLIQHGELKGQLESALQRITVTEKNFVNLENYAHETRHDFNNKVQGLQVTVAKLEERER